MLTNARICSRNDNMQTGEITATQHLQCSAGSIEPLPKFTDIAVVIKCKCQSWICACCFLCYVTEEKTVHSAKSQH